MKKMTRKDTLSLAELASLIGPIACESTIWAESVRELMHGRPTRFEALAAQGSVPLSVMPVMRRLATGKSMKFDGKPRKHSFEGEARVWRVVMCQRHLGALDREAKKIAAAETGLSVGAVRGIVEDWVRAGLTLDAWRAMQTPETLTAIEAFRRH